jgi:hypothetical protein
LGKRDVEKEIVRENFEKMKMWKRNTKRKFWEKSKKNMRRKFWER